MTDKDASIYDTTIHRKNRAQHAHGDLCAAQVCLWANAKEIITYLAPVHLSARKAEYRIAWIIFVQRF
jgi:hypothetical protein